MASVIAGAAIGAAIGGPIGGVAGAWVGAGSGAIVGGLLSGLTAGQKTVINVGKLSDRSFQGSEYGGDIPRVYGTVGLSGSQIVWMENNQLKEVVKKKKSGGKGGTSTVTKTYSYYATFALMLCQGEIAGIRRIWCSDKLIYNAGSDDLETIIASNQAAKGWRLYRGTDDQLPDPRYEADVGVGNAPAFRGYTYIVFDDFALADYSNTLQAAQFKVEVVNELTEQSINLLYTSLPGLNAGLAYSMTVSSFDGYTASSWLASENNASALGNLVLVEKNKTYAYRTLTDHLAYFPIGSFIPMVCRLQDSTAAATVSRQFSGNGWAGVWESNVFHAIQLPNLHVGKALIEGFDRAYLLTGQLIVSRIYQLDYRSLGGSADLSANSGIPYPSGWDLFDFTLIPMEENFALIAKALSGVINIAVYDGTSYTTKTITYTSPAISVRTPNSYANGVVSFAMEYTSTQCRILQIDIANGAIVSDRWQPFSSPGTSASYENMRYENNLIYMSGVSGTGLFESVVEVDKQAAQKVSLADVITAECSLSSLISATDLDVSLLTQQVNGYRVSGGTIRSVIEPLQGAYPFDVVPSGYKVKFVPRGQPSVLTIPWEDLAANDGEDIGDSLPYSREMDSQLPQKVTITALSSTREYASATQSYERLNTTAVNVEQRDIPLVLSDDEIAQMSEKLLFLRWLERDDFDGPVLPPTYLSLEAADVVTVQAKFGTFELRLTEINYESDGRVTCKSKLNNAAIYTSNAAGAPGPGPSGNISLSGATVMVLADAPMIYETEQNSAGFSTAASGYADGWPGAVLVRSADSGQTWSELQGYSGKCTIGVANNALSANSGALVYEGPGLTVSLVSGELESVTLDQMLAGANIALYGADGRWEVIRFRDAALQSNGSYVLTGIIRGDKGTEWATGLHKTGDTFVLATDPDNIFVGTATETLGISMLYRGVTVGNTVDSASDQELTYRGVNLKPLSGVYPVGSRNGTGDLSVTWMRRSRFSSSWWVTGISAPVGEASESYEIDVMDGATVKRTIASTTPAITYTAAQQVTDFGSAQASISLRIYQISAVVGRGYALETTL